jgi:hypothetical protein
VPAKSEVVTVWAKSALANCSESALLDAANRSSAIVMTKGTQSEAKYPGAESISGQHVHLPEMLVATAPS